MAEQRNGSRVQSVDRGVDILEFLAQNGWSGVTDVGHALGVHKSTAFRLLSTLESRGLVEQHVDSGKYHLGFGLVHLARAVSVGPDLTRHAREACQRLADESSESVSLAVLEGDAVVTIDQVIPQESSVVSRSWLGRRTPLHATSPGKVFLAFIPETRRATILDGPHEEFTASTITDPRELRASIARVAEDGFSFCFEELEEGLAAMAAPIRGADGTVVAAISMSAPSYRMPEERRPGLAKALLEAAADVSARFGYSQIGGVGLDES
ncbi:IclR family transcriptional regulator [Egibacter rhizosphaerae]|uniref:IclR family transcriptional regulator n=1 Tax=Egibacter rhizosphaerae TaxID=1670831 RepID=UPI00197AA4EA|nr:IclR family transcriptional regulator [Egibacter rhizosphaerae]